MFGFYFFVPFFIMRFWIHKPTKQQTFNLKKRKFLRLIISQIKHQHKIDNYILLIQMQQSNNNKQQRRNRLESIRSSIKNIPILHSTTDRINRIISSQKNIQILPYDNDSTSLQDKCFDLKIISENQFAFEAKYSVGQKIGQGAHGFVKKCFYKQSGKLYALKIIRSDDEFFYHLKRNFVNIKQLDHPNIMKYKAFYFDRQKQTCMLVMQYLPFPSLENYKFESQDELKRIIYEIILGLQYLHKKHICHRDIKPENVLYDKQTKKSILIDFGVSCQMLERGTQKQMLTLTGTPYYRAPEMFQGGGYDQRVDLWALGVLIYKLVTKNTPFQSEYHSDTINNILKGEVLFTHIAWSKFSHLVKDLISHLLRPRQSRLNINETKNHFWFQNLRLEMDENQMTKSAGFQIFFSLKRAITDADKNSGFRTRNPTISPKLSGVMGSPQMFSLQKYQQEQSNMRWISLQNSNQMDLIESEDEQSTVGMSPRGKGAQIKRNDC